MFAPDAGEGERDVATRCIERARATHQPFVTLEAERVQGGMIAGYAFFGLDNGEAYRVDYMSDPCATTPTPCPQRGSTVLLHCTKLSLVCEHLDCWSCDGQDVIASCDAGGP